MNQIFQLNHRVTIFVLGSGDAGVALCSMGQVDMCALGARLFELGADPITKQRNRGLLYDVCDAYKTISIKNTGKPFFFFGSCIP